MEPLLSVIGAVVTLVATGVGVVVAVDQLTLRARLRRTAEVAQTFIAQEPDGQRQRVLTSIRDVAVARLAAGWVVPWWRFAEVIVSLFIGPVGVGITAARSGLSSGLLWFFLTSLVAFGLPARRGTRVYLERQRIAREYLSRQHVGSARLDMLDQMEGGTRAEFVVGLLLGLGLTLASLGTGLLIHRSEQTWGLLCLIAGLGIAWSPTTWLRRHAVRPLSG